MRRIRARPELALLTWVLGCSSAPVPDGGAAMDVGVLLATDAGSDARVDEDASTSDAGRDSGPAGDAGASLTGTVRGRALEPLEAVFVLDTSLGGDELLVIRDATGACTTPSYTASAGSTVLFIDFESIGEVVAPGTWTIGRNATASFRVLDASCQPFGEGFAVFATGGEIVLSRVELADGGTIEGRIEAQFPDGEVVAGVFTARTCATNYWGTDICLP